jgi:5-deoxy-glucuronate isomerase
VIPQPEVRHEWHFPSGCLARDDRDVFLTPKEAAWKYAGLQIISLDAMEHFSLITDGFEAAIIPLAATNLKVNIDDCAFELEGRVGVFVGTTDWVFAPLNSQVTITATGASELAIATAIATQRHSPLYCKRDSFDLEIRGTGAATREVRPFMHPEVFVGADRLMAVELITPDGNWSSYPPHRHDGIGTCPINNEEIYYFKIGNGNSPHGDPTGWGMHRTYTAPDDPAFSVDANVTVRDGDVFIVPRGYHGPCAAAPGYPMYYLNVLAGSKPRSMAFCDDPEHAWIRDSWVNQAPDARLPWRCP